MRANIFASFRLAVAVVLLSHTSAFADRDVLTVSGGNVHGRVHALAGEAKQLAATVRLMDEGGKVVAEVRAEDDGRFAISAPAKGRYTLAVAAEGFVEARAVVVTKRLSQDTPFLQVQLGADAARPYGGGGITIPTATRRVG